MTETPTLAQRLRTRNGRADGFGLGPVCDEAAAAIEAQAAQIAELTAAHHAAIQLANARHELNVAQAAQIAERDAQIEALRAELDAQRLYARALCKAVDAATDFAGTVGGGSSWWEDVWADHESALDRARDQISAATNSDAAMAAKEPK